MKPKGTKKPDKRQLEDPLRFVTQAEFDEIGNWFMNRFIDLMIENAALREALQKNGVLSYAQVAAQRKELERHPVMMQVRRELGESGLAEIRKLLEQFVGRVQ